MPPSHAAIESPDVRWIEGSKFCCWAVITAAVVRHYGRARHDEVAARVTAFDVMDRVRSRDSLATTGHDPQDFPYELEKALVTYRHFANYHSHTVGASELSHELEAQHPVAISFRWAGSAPDYPWHYALILRVDRVDDSATVWDPRSGVISSSLTKLKFGYSDGGLWQATYFTQP